MSDVTAILGEVGTARSRMARGGRVTFGVATVALGTLCATVGSLGAILQPVPRWMPLRHGLAYAAGAVMIAAGAALLVPRLTRVAALVLTAYYGGLWLLLLHLPSTLAQPGVEDRWEGCGLTMALAVGAWILLAASSRPASGLGQRALGPSGVRLAQRIYGLGMPLVGLNHLIEGPAATVFVPAWLPFPLAWVYLTGVGHIAAGLAIAFGVVPWLAALLEAAQITAFVLLSHVPGVLGAPGDRVQWAMLLYAAVIAGAAWIVAASIPRERIRPLPGLVGAAIVLVACSLGCAGAARDPSGPARATAAASTTSPGARPDPLLRANGDFHKEYAAGRAREQATLGASRPYLFLDGDKLVLRHDGRAEERSLASARFDALKHASHVPIASLSAILAREDPAALRALAARMREVDPEITAARFGVAEPAAHGVVRASIELLEGAAAKAPTEDELHAFGLRTRADTLTLLQAGCDEALTTLDAAVRQLRPFAGNAWSQTVVIVTTDHQSRAEEVGTQYFEHLFHEEAREGALGESRILVVERIGPNEGPVQALASHLYDQHLSVLLFDDPVFLQGDVLGKRAGPTLARLLATPP